MTDTVTPSMAPLTEEQSRTLAISGILVSSLTASYFMFALFVFMTFRKMPGWSIGATNIIFGVFGTIYSFRIMAFLRDNIPAADSRHLRLGIGLFSTTAVSFIAIMISILILALSVEFVPPSITFWTSEPIIGFLTAATSVIGAIHKLSLIMTVAGMVMIFSGLRDPRRNRQG